MGRNSDLRIAINRNLLYLIQSPLSGLTKFVATLRNASEKKTPTITSAMFFPPHLSSSDKTNVLFQGCIFPVCRKPVRHSVLRVGSRKSAESYLLTLPEGGFRALKEQFLACHRARDLLLHQPRWPLQLDSCNSRLKEGSSPSF